MSTAYVYADGPGAPPGPPPPGTGDLVVAADGGLAHARRLGHRVDLVVGDLDSVDPGALDDAVAAGARVQRHPADKDATDLELAVAAAVDAGATRLVVVGSDGGRLDHLLGAVGLLCGPATEGCEVDAHLGSARLAVARPGPAVAVPAAAGATVSLVPVHGPARGVRTTGLRWPLVDEDLAPGTTRGVSNQVVADGATVSLTDGVLALIAAEVAS